MNYYTVCPSCGYKLLKAGEGSNIEIFCPKCKNRVFIEIKDSRIIIDGITNEKASDNNDT